MKIIASIAMAGMIAASTLTGTIAPANAGSFKFSVHNHSGGHYHGGHHKKRRYHHRRHHSDYGGAIVAGTILGLALGAIATPSYHYPPAVYGHHRSQRYSGHYPHAVGPHRNARHVRLVLFPL